MEFFRGLGKVIPAVKEADDLPLALALSAPTVFLLAGEILDLDKTIARVREAGKLAFLHFDLVQGLGRDGAAVRFVARRLKADGVVTSRTNIIRLAKAEGLLTVQRLFMLDSAALETGIRVLREGEADAVEVLPGLVVPRIIHQLRARGKLPLIAGGLLTSVQDAREALAAGAVAVSTSNRNLWQEFEQEGE